MKTATFSKGDGSEKGMRKFLQNLQPSSGGKENLVGAGRIPQESMIDSKSAVKSEHVFTDVDVKVKDKKDKHSISKVNPSLYKKLIIEDLTSTAGPSEKYWEVIAERRRKALEEVLEENKKLQDLVAALEEENTSCKKLLESSTELINTLKEMINENFLENNDESNSCHEDSILNSSDGSSTEIHVNKKMKTIDSESESQ
ncbi:geminin-like isoform X2 [Daktulosphaira vitifoliae]|uniref:geminin-like isoform X2 n=1 Tax=Daktulosphaira vitifoliae TaxID=58002 RepID=UPI0021AAEF86|nr:geminin-like isoform X2 [Daktulosphaira vitifoliae]